MADTFKILVGDDLTENSHRALDAALSLAEFKKTEITVLHVVPQIPSSLSEDLQRSLYEKVVEDLKANVETRLKQNLEKYKDDVVRVHVSYGEVAQTIAEVAQTTEANVVVMGRPHVSTLSDFFFGTSVQRVVRQVKKSVLIVQEKKLFTRKRILVPVDLTQNCLGALEVAADVAQGTGSKLTILHAAYSPYAAVYQSMLAGNGPELVQAALDAERTAFFELVKSYQDVNLVDEVLFVEGRPAEEILRRQENFDLIVMASESGSGWTKSLLGSVTERVLEHATRSLLVVKH